MSKLSDSKPTDSAIYLEEQVELNEVAASLGSVSTFSSGSCPGSTVNTVSTASCQG
ncbi:MULTISPECIES: thiocillin family RiPP [Bacillus]|uniref:thiocillin family RiPP n=1 Tax=Bacillus TaxID=1386 RepID=UPI0001A08A5E|nr:thiocillin family RiPP [Bacillus cereus]EEL08939.1 hypothetical protein bcere0015_47950 [Bacillus cereus BDRD-Cer4]KZD83367.1 hypothetical protein B4155_2218 [Bacillus cereus]MCC3288475.1 thiocillin family RiPP [Bacillus cereus]MEB9997483.1 thiocillin family RiPP [Bacillus cereus]QCX96885.1 thiocillin family RiPP [Bacillus cereus ATCC 14579]